MKQSEFKLDGKTPRCQIRNVQSLRGGRSQIHGRQCSEAATHEVKGTRCCKNHAGWLVLRYKKQGEEVKAIPIQT